MLKFFRAVALVEGVTTLLLFLVAMPAKYLFGYGALTPPLGLIHGWAFLAYLGVMVVALWGRGFSVLGWFRTVFAAFVPFGTFLNDPWLKRRQIAHEQARAAAG